MAAVVLVFGQRLGEVVLALIGDPGDVILAGEIGVVAAVAAVLLRQRLAARHPRGVAGVSRRHRLRQSGDEIREGAQIVVGHRLRHLVHRVEYPELLAEHEQLDQRIGRLLAAERGRVLGFRRAALAMAGKARRSALLDGLGICGEAERGERRGHCELAHRSILATVQKENRGQRMLPPIHDFN
ncbi:hypothetical protein NS44R_14675, partial [Mammaliicoccus sciuri]